MQPALGWTLLSREALKRAEEHLRDWEQGVRDEIGFLALHQAYADRFFPGTSVLQTRLRYILFVPWLYDRIARGVERKQVGRMMQREEIILAGRLRETYGASEGVIGGRSYPKPTSQPPSLVYWTALMNWGILRPLIDGSYPSRAIIHRALGRTNTTSQLTDHDKQPLEESRALFVAPPEPPKEWDNPQAHLTFDLRSCEEQFIRRQLISVSRPGQPSSPCLLSRLVERRVPVAKIADPWLAGVLKAADAEDRAALLNAQQAAALAAVGRAVYAALVEQICEVEDKRPMPDYHRAHLEQVLHTYRQEALKLDVAVVAKDAPRLVSSGILEILRETQQWLKCDGDFMELRPVYEQAEIRRKGRRARLAQRLAGRERRAEWSPEDHTLAGPLHYRWGNVQRLLNDLRIS
jgi:hypothetical protein